MLDAGQEEKVIEVVRGLALELNKDENFALTLNTHLEWDLGLASIERSELLIRLEAALGERFSARAVFEAQTIADLLKIVSLDKESPLDLSVVELEIGEIPPYPVQAQSLIEALEYQAKWQPKRKTLIFWEEGEEIAQWSYLDLWQAAERVAGGLAQKGVAFGDRVGIMLPTGPEYVAAFFGVLWLGAIPVPLYPPFRLDQLEDYIRRQAAILEVAGVNLLISFDRAKAVLPLLKMSANCLKEVITVPELSAHAPKPRVGDYSLIQFTSGSTGLPKGVTLTQPALLHNLRAYGYGMQLGKDDVTISWLPLYHDMGLIGTLLGSIYHGQPLVLMGPQDFLARPSRWLWAIHKYRGTVSPAPNFAYEICARKIPSSELEGLDLSSWRIALNGAEAVRPDTLRRFSERFAAYGFKNEAHFPAYGLAEATLAVTFPAPGKGPVIDKINREALENEGVAAAVGVDDPALELVACGRPLPEMEIRIVDDKGRVLEEHRCGHLQFRGPSALAFYYNNPEATSLVKDSQGWVNTGDLAYLNEGQLYLTGRSKDLIVIAGRNLHPEDIEDIVACLEGVRRGCIAAFGLPNEDDGTEGLVVVAESRDYQNEGKAADIVKAIGLEIQKKLGVVAYKVLVVAPHSVPKTPSGKIRRSETRKRLLEGSLGKRKGLAAQVATILKQGAKAAAKNAKDLPLRAGRSLWCHSLLLGCLSAPQLASLFSVKRAQRLIPPLASFYLRATGVKIKVRGGLEYKGPCVLVINHASSIDALILSAIFPRQLSFLVAPWIAEHPLFRQLILRLGHIVVHRGDPKEAKAQEAKIQELIKQNTCCLAAFPEGGIEISPGLRPFSLGAFKAAQAAGIPVVPIALKGTRTIQPWPRTQPYRGEVEVTIGAPIWAKGPEWSHLLEFADSARSFIAKYCGDPISSQRMRRRD